MSPFRPARKRPVVVEAIRYTEETRDEIIARVPGVVHAAVDDDGCPYELLNLRIPTLEGAMTASVGDWIIIGVKGEFYPCKPDIFDATYDQIE